MSDIVEVGRFEITRSTPCGVKGIYRLYAYSDLIDEPFYRCTCTDSCYFAFEQSPIKLVDQRYTFAEDNEYITTNFMGKQYRLHFEYANEILRWMVYVASTRSDQIYDMDMDITYHNGVTETIGVIGKRWEPNEDDPIGLAEVKRMFTAVDSEDGTIRLFRGEIEAIDILKCI